MSFRKFIGYTLILSGVTISLIVKAPSTVDGGRMILSDRYLQYVAGTIKDKNKGIILEGDLLKDYLNSPVEESLEEFLGGQKIND